MEQNFGFKLNKNSVCWKCQNNGMKCDNTEKLFSKDLDKKQYVVFCNQFRNIKAKSIFKDDDEELRTY